MKKLITAALVAVLAPATAYAQGTDLAAGKALWEGPLQCRNCHGAAGEGGFGPDLAGRGLSAAQFTQAVRKPWGIMPMFIDSQVSDSELGNLAAYFASLPKNAAPAAWRVPVDPTMPHGQQVMVSMGCAQCHGATFNNARTTLGGTNGDFDLFKSIVYSYTETSPKVDSDLAAARNAVLGAPLGGGGGRGNAGPPRPRMGNFVPARVSENDLRDIYDWAKNEIGFRPSLQARFAAAGAGAPSYNLLLANTGLPGKGVAAQAVVIDLSIPSGVTVASATGSGYRGVHKDTTGADVAEWQVSSLSPKDVQTFSVTLSSAPADPLGLKGIIHWGKPGPKSGSSLDSVNFALAAPGGRRGG